MGQEVETVASTEITLTMRDVEEVLSAFEKKYNVSSSAIICDAELRATLPEDDVFEWMAYVDHKNELQRVDAEVHREYLHEVSPSFEKEIIPKGPSQLALAA